MNLDDSVRRISLANGRGIAVVDTIDFEMVSRYSWWLHTGGYAKAYTGGGRKNPKQIYMHRLIMRAEAGQEMDHRNGNKLDNRRSNLRFCTRSQNMANISAHVDGLNKLKGVTFDRRWNKYYARIQVEGRRIWLGNFQYAYEAAQAYACASAKYFGEYAAVSPVTMVKE